MTELKLNRASFVRVMRNVRRRVREMERDAERFLEDEAKSIFEESQRRVPVDTGELRASGSVEVRGTKAMIRYTAPHAIAVHEDLTINHADGEAKFLENPVRDSAGSFGARLAKAVRI